jgi:hypothetical protein
MLQSIHVANCRLVEQILKCAAVVETTADLRHQFVRNVYSKPATLDSAVKNMAGMLLTAKTSFALLSNASGTPKIQRSQSSRPKVGSLFLKPIRDIYRKFFWGWHAVYVPYNHIYSQEKSYNYCLCSNL